MQIAKAVKISRKCIIVYQNIAFALIIKSAWHKLHIPLDRNYAALLAGQQISVSEIMRRANEPGIELDQKTRMISVLSVLLGCQGIDEFRAVPAVYRISENVKCTALHQ